MAQCSWRYLLILVAFNFPAKDFLASSYDRAFFSTSVLTGDNRYLYLFESKSAINTTTSVFTSSAMPGPLLPTSGNGIARREQSTPSLRIPGPRTEAGRAIMRSHSDLRNLALAAADDDIEERPHRPVAAQASSAAPPTQQAPIIPHPHPTPLSASAIFQGRVERWISALDLLERTRRLEAEQADVAAATAGMQAMALDSGSPSVGFAPAPIQASPRLPMGCDECYDGGVMPLS
ncbi:hypothetical protein FPQ18DRAFT_306424 [Pyronema domesticum]|nr:hypothetical protein FPQ18DRAFT_306424 [Pyronema domesticum]